MVIAVVTMEESVCLPVSVYIGSNIWICLNMFTNMCVYMYIVVQCTIEVHVHISVFLTSHLRSFSISDHSISLWAGLFFNHARQDILLVVREKSCTKLKMSERIIL